MFIRCSARVVVSGLIHSRSFVLYLAYIWLCLGLALLNTNKTVDMALWLMLVSYATITSLLWRGYFLLSFWCRARCFF